MTTSEIINLINTITLRAEKNTIEQGVITLCNSDNTYNVLITGSSGQLYKISPLNSDKTTYSNRDSVLIGYAFANNAIPNILGKSEIEIPEEEEVVVKEKAVNAGMHCAMGDWIAGYIKYSVSNSAWTLEDTFSSYDSDNCYNICVDADENICMVETDDYNYIRRYTSAGVFIDETQIEV